MKNSYYKHQVELGQHQLEMTLLIITVVLGSMNLGLNIYQVFKAKHPTEISSTQPKQP